MSTFVRNLLNEQRKRLVGSIMTYLEQNVFDRLEPAERDELRRKVLASASQYHDVCLDMVKASVNDGTAINDEAMRLLSQINHKVSLDHKTGRG